MLFFPLHFLSFIPKTLIKIWNIGVVHLALHAMTSQFQTNFWIQRM